MLFILGHLSCRGWKWAGTFSQCSIRSVSRQFCLRIPQPPRTKEACHSFPFSSGFAARRPWPRKPSLLQPTDLKYGGNIIPLFPNPHAWQSLARLSQWSTGGYQGISRLGWSSSQYCVVWGPLSKTIKTFSPESWPQMELIEQVYSCTPDMMGYQTTSLKAG